MKFLQKREKETAPQIPGHDQLVPWKSGPQEKEALTIPLRATLVNTIGIIFSKLSEHADVKHWYIQLHDNVYFCTFSYNHCCRYDK